MRQLFLLLDCSYHAFSLAILHKKKKVFVIWMFVQYDCAFYFSIEAKLSSNKIARSILLHEESCCYYPIPSFVLSFNRSDFIGFSIELQLRWSLFVRIVFARARLRWASKFEEKPGLFLHLFQLLVPNHSYLRENKEDNNLELEILAWILRQNQIRNRVISGLSGQKPCTRIILSLLQSFLHFWKAKDINSCLK